jgi:hypothetical protein
LELLCEFSALCVNQGQSEFIYPKNTKLTLRRNLSFTFQIALVGHNNNGKVILVLDSQDLLMKGADFFKRITACNGVHTQEAFTGSHVLFTHGTASQGNEKKKISISKRH